MKNAFSLIESPASVVSRITSESWELEGENISAGIARDGINRVVVRIRADLANDDEDVGSRVENLTTVLVDVGDRNFPVTRTLFQIIGGNFGTISDDNNHSVNDSNVGELLDENGPKILVLGVVEGEAVAVDTVEVLVDQELALSG